MLSAINPSDPRLTALLSSCGLPTEDLGADSQQFWGAIDQSERILAVGGLEICRNNAILRSLAVAEDQRKSGHGAKILQKLIAEAKRQNLQALYLLTETAELYFQHRGFEVIERAGAPEHIRAAPQFADICPDTATAMRMWL